MFTLCVSGSNSVPVIESEGVDAVAIGNEGKFVLSASDGGAIHYWRVGGQQLLREFEGHIGPVRDVAISPDGRMGLSAGDDRRLRFWQLP
jgi:WD40 repeat protein